MQAQLLERREVGTTSRTLRFSLPSPRHRLGVPVGQHLTFTAQVCAGLAPALSASTCCRQPPAIAQRQLLQVVVLFFCPPARCVSK